MKHSIQNRLLVTTTCVLVVFLTITGWILDRSFSDSVVTGAQEQMRLVIYSLMGSVDEQQGQLMFNDDLFEPRLSQPESGLYAQVATDLGDLLWQSASTLTSDVSFPQAVGEPGAFTFGRLEDAGKLFYLSYAVIWEGVDTEQVIFAVATDQTPYLAAIAEFRRSLGLGLGAATLLFVLAQLLALRWGLLPLRSMAEEVQELEQGERDSLSQGYPKELQGLAENLDRFVAHEERSRTRYRNALEDLAHSLKTPLAVVKNSLLDAQPDRSLLHEQLERMQNTVTHQLSRASAAGPVVVGKPVEIGAVVERLVRALQTAYVERGIELTQALSASSAARGDERDFLEMLGNVLENAFKYTHKRVHVEVCIETLNKAEYVVVRVADDGRGIPESLRKHVLSRGRRLDEMESGQGIGLAVVAELVRLYQGQLELGESEWSGALITLRIPV